MTFPRPCLAPDCRQVVVGAARCAEHTSAVNRARGSSSARGYGWRWRKLAAAYRARTPLCEWTDPDGHCSRVAADVDHIRPIRAGGLDRWDNAQSLCRVHHARKTREDEARWPI
ncbi:MAG: HNH endonuclease [Candidatus Limnocylindria bacterium]